MQYTADFVHRLLKKELESYIATQYFGKIPLLRDALRDRLSETGIISQAPYIEASPVYKASEAGLSGAAVPPETREFLLEMAEKGLGVFDPPYEHQVKSLEAVFRGQDVFVSTGTGSGKTECFLWPLAARLMKEAVESPDTWEKRGIRALILYPMNALVSDQLSRLRRTLGDPEGRFQALFRRRAGRGARVPAFGMYTGRTPYPGAKPDLQQDKALQKTLSKFLKPEESEGSEKPDLSLYEKLLKSGKIPAKKNLQAFCDALGEGEHLTGEDDAELITRFEMQMRCPDILITNYSMLEYMLLRPREQSIWDSTRKWLAASPENKLLFVIDEAHMYRGSAGGEVSLLIRRLFSKLGIGRDKAQFILTTASMPNRTAEDKAAVRAFASELTCAEDTGGFEFLTGNTEVDYPKDCLDIPFGKFLGINLDALQDPERAFPELKAFWSGVEGAPADFPDLGSLQQWEYENLDRYAPFQKLLRICRGNAASLPEIGRAAFYGEEPVAVMTAANALLALTGQAKDSAGRYLLPARLHMLFRGLKGVCACTNPACPGGKTDGKISLGALFLSDGTRVCPSCGSQVYDLYNDRRCGALFFRGYVLAESYEDGKLVYLWRNRGELLDREMREIHLYIPENGFRPASVRGSQSLVPCYLDTASGFIDFTDDSKEGQPGYRTLYYSNKELKGRPDIITFGTCPHCEQLFSGRGITSFGTRGNEPFYNLIQAQFNAQPPAEGKADPERYPNEGRKVLLFSDSRQRAARLARDMSESADTGASRQLFALAIRGMQESGQEKTLSQVYGYFALEAAKHHDRLFSGDDRQQFKEDLSEIWNRYERAKRRNRPLDLDKRLESSAPRQMKVILLKLWCSEYNSLQSTGVSWLKPRQSFLEDAVDALYDAGIEVSDEEFLEVFHSWVTSALRLSCALGPSIPDDIRSEVKRGYGCFGLSPDWKFTTVIKNAMKWSSREEEAWKRVLTDNFLAKSAESGNFFVELDKVVPAWEPDHKWLRCERCSDITPYALRGCCPSCGSPRIRPMSAGDRSSLGFWLDPVREAAEGGPIRLIRTEEHTAQLSHKDQRDELWSKTEQYELMFQDLVQEDENPVDVLSSTTTMEVGIDLGSLLAVGLRNVPPMRENYQQRAGRAGRRGSSLATIVTFCEGGPYDSLYFKNPAPMLRGDPRQPWIESRSQKLAVRHLSILALEAFGAGIGKSLDAWPTLEFFERDFAPFREFLANEWPARMARGLLPAGNPLTPEAFESELTGILGKLARKCESHPELYQSDFYGKPVQKPLLDSLFEEGAIPTFSFPKDVVSAYVMRDQNRIKYEVQRGLDIAVSEYAPGRSIVVDKSTYQIGGFFRPESLRKGGGKNPAEGFVSDPNYLKDVVKCPSCGWFGLKSDDYRSCPFCGSSGLEQERPLLKPWGFGPRDGRSIQEVQVREEYSAAQAPLYSTLPESDKMEPAAGTLHIRAANRTGQRILMVNRGPKNKGFMVCPDCGAAMPGETSGALKGIRAPYLSRSAYKCRHEGAFNISLGYDFVTDMLVLEFDLEKRGFREDEDYQLWLRHAAQTLAEAIRIAACRRLDIEFTELVTGYRKRESAKGLFIDIYLYDSLSSGAGYSERIAGMLPEIFADTRALLAGCTCQSACFDCLKNYRNQFIHANLDRFAGMQLLEWGLSGALPREYSADEQEELLAPFKKLLKDAGIAIRRKGDGLFLEKKGLERTVLVYPAMLSAAGKADVCLSSEMIRFAKPYALRDLLQAF